MASGEELLVSVEVYEQTKSNLGKMGLDKIKDFLIKSGCEEAWIKTLVKEEVTRYCLIEKGCIKGVVPKVQVPGLSGGIEALVQMMQRQMEQAKAEARAKDEMQAKMLEQAKAEARSREEAQTKMMEHMMRRWEEEKQELHDSRKRDIEQKGMARDEARERENLFESQIKK
jgi:hypothetical protein